MVISHLSSFVMEISFSSLVWHSLNFDQDVWCVNLNGERYMYDYVKVNASKILYYENRSQISLLLSPPYHLYIGKMLITIDITWIYCVNVCPKIKSIPKLWWFSSIISKFISALLTDRMSDSLYKSVNIIVWHVLSWLWCCLIALFYHHKNDLQSIFHTR